MPCMTSDGMGDAYREDPQARRAAATAQAKADLLEVLLCAVIRATGIEEAMKKADWKEAGINAQALQVWWEEHQAKDKAKAAEEVARVAAEAHWRAAWEKLSPEERRTIGLRDPADTRSPYGGSK